MPEESFILKRTDDGSSTLYFPEYGECTHTVHGAYTEALYKHIYPSGIINRTDKELTILDIGFGLGYNVLALLSTLNYSDKEKIRIFSFEKEKKIAPFLDKLSLTDDQQIHFRKIKQAFNTGSFKEGPLEIYLLWGDARIELKNLIPEYENSISAVFHDPHSPGKNSELWTVEFFSLLRKLMDNQARLTTYSFARQVRGGLSEAGLHIAPFTSHVFDKEGTLASKDTIENQLEGEHLNALLSEVKSTPYHDNASMDLDRESIRLQRVKAMARKREEKRKTLS